MNVVGYSSRHDFENLVKFNLPSNWKMSVLVFGPSKEGKPMGMMTDYKQRFESVALEHMDSIYRGALWMLSGDESAAQDLAQDVYLRAYRFFDKFKEGTNCKAWLWKILRNLYVNSYRKKSKQPLMVELGEAEVSGDLISLGTPEDEVFENLLDDEIKSAIGALPEVYRLPIILSDLEGFPYKEIAEILDVPIGTVMSRLFRGRKRLRRSLYEYARERGYAA